MQRFARKPNKIHGRDKRFIGVTNDSYSLQLKKDGGNLNKLFRVDGTVRKIIAISAYTDIETISQLIKLLKKAQDQRGKASLKIFIDRSSSRFSSDEEMKKALLDKNAKIRKAFSDDSGIYLVRLGKLFHSKAYLIEGNVESKVIFGSMNLTQMGINANEEILLSAKQYKKKDVLKYLKSLK